MYTKVKNDKSKADFFSQFRLTIGYPIGCDTKQSQEYLLEYDYIHAYIDIIDIIDG